MNRIVRPFSHDGVRQEGLTSDSYHPVGHVDRGILHDFLSVLPQHGRVLDIGCGPRSRWIPVGLRHRLVAVDIDPALMVGALPPNVEAHVGSGESMPFCADQSFDLVVARVSLPYMRPQRAIPEITRVLAPGGKIFLTLHDAGSVWRHLGHSLRRGAWKDVVFRLYVLVNGLWAALGGTPFAFPLKRSRFEWFQHDRSMMQQMANAGFVDITSHRYLVWPRRLYTTWVVTATRGSASA